VAQQLRQATPHEEWPRFLIRDNDGNYGPKFDRLATSSGITVLRTPVRAPRANATCERFLGSVRRECLDHLLLLGERQLRRALHAYVDDFNRARPHQGLGQATPEGATPLEQGVRGRGRVVALPVLGGLHHDYRRVGCSAADGRNRADRRSSRYRPRPDATDPGLPPACGRAQLEHDGSRCAV